MIEHEFVNTRLTLSDRRNFRVVEDNWRDPAPNGRPVKPWLVGLLKDAINRIQTGPGEWPTTVKPM